MPFPMRRLIAPATLPCCARRCGFHGGFQIGHEDSPVAGIARMRTCVNRLHDGVDQIVRNHDLQFQLGLGDVLRMHRAIASTSDTVDPGR